MSAANTTGAWSEELARTRVWPLVLGTALLAYLISQYFSHGLQRYPGPFLAKFTKAWHFLSIRSNKHHEHIIKLHRKYGGVVRIGPNTLSIAQPDYVPRIYSLQAGYNKGPMYDAFAQRVQGKRMATTLSQRDPKMHGQMTRPIAGAYKLSVLVHYEPLVDEICESLLRKIDSIIGDSKSCILDFDKWARFCAIDLILYLTFGAPWGLIEAGSETGEVFAKLDSSRALTALTSAMPWTSYITKFNPIVAYFASNSSELATWCVDKIQARQAERASGVERKEDFLDKFMDAATIDTPPGLDYPKLIDWCLVNFLAGSDTVTITLRAVIYYILKAPEKQARLIAEIQEADLSHPISYAAATKLPYLDACLKEALRIHPPVGLGMERVADHLQMPDGYILPPTTVVSMNAWAVNRQDLFGDDPDEFRPERWLQASNETPAEHLERMNAWKRADLTFSAGRHSCTGKYVAYMELYKLIPTLFAKYDLALKNPAKEWRQRNRFEVHQSGLEVVFSLRG